MRPGIVGHRAQLLQSSALFEVKFSVSPVLAFGNSEGDVSYALYQQSSIRISYDSGSSLAQHMNRG
jgi:hypothetical protein